MPWQDDAFRLIGELFTEEECRDLDVPFGTPAYREIWITVPRQSGKTTIILVVIIDRAVFWHEFEDRRQGILYTAQTGKAARKKLLTDMVPLMENGRLTKRRLGRIKSGAGHEEVPFHNDGVTTGIVWPGSNSEDAAHGETLTLGLVDEAFTDVDDRREQAILAAMATKDHGQLLGTSTMGTQASLYLNRKVAIGRKAVKDPASGIAYIEYSAPEGTMIPGEYTPGVGIYDTDMWMEVHPALGHTVNIRAMQHAAETMKPPEFARAWLNIPGTVQALSKIDPLKWAKVSCDCRAGTEHSCEVAAPIPSGGLVWAFDVAADRSHAAIAVFSQKSRTAELVAYGSGTDNVIDTLLNLQSTHGGVVAYHKTGPGANLLDEDILEDPYWVGLGSGECAQACGTLFDAVHDATIGVRRHALLTEGIEKADTRTIDDAWRWARRSSPVDISPLYALTLAVGCPVESADGDLWTL